LFGRVNEGGGEVKWGLLITFFRATCTRRASFVVQADNTTNTTSPAQQTHSLRCTSVLTCSIASYRPPPFSASPTTPVLFVETKDTKSSCPLLSIRTLQIFSLKINYIETKLLIPLVFATVVNKMSNVVKTLTSHGVNYVR
jgi:hypothetical protein